MIKTYKPPCCIAYRALNNARVYQPAHRHANTEQTDTFAEGRHARVSSDMRVITREYPHAFYYAGPSTDVTKRDVRYDGGQRTLAPNASHTPETSGARMRDTADGNRGPHCPGGDDGRIRSCATVCTV